MNPEETKAYKAIVAYIERNIELINSLPTIEKSQELPGIKTLTKKFIAEELNKRLGDINPTLTQQQAWLTAVKNSDPLPEEVKTTLLTAIEAQSGILKGDINTLKTQIEVLNTDITGLKSKEQTPFNIRLITRKKREINSKTNSLGHKEKERTLLSQCTQYITNPLPNKTRWQRIRSLFSRAISVLFKTPNQQDPIGKSFGGTNHCPVSDSLQTSRASKATIDPSKGQHVAPKETPGNSIK